jgi:hypothetical protein
MARRITDETQRKVMMASTVRDVVRQFVLIEAAEYGNNLSAAMEALLVDALIAKGYPADILRPVNKKEDESEKQQTVLNLYRQRGNITEAASVAGVSLSTVYLWVAREPDFASEFRKIKASKAGYGGAHRSPDHGAPEGLRPRIQRPKTIEGVPVNKPGESWEDYQKRGGNGFAWVEYDESGL